MNQYYILVMILYILEDVRYRYGDMTLVLSVPGLKEMWFCHRGSTRDSWPLMAPEKGVRGLYECVAVILPLISVGVRTNKPFANNLFENVFVRHIIFLSGAQAVVLAMLIQFSFSISSQSQGSAVTVTDRIRTGSRGNAHFCGNVFFFYISTLSSAHPGLQQRDVTHSPLNAAWHRAGWLSLSLVPQTSSGIRLWLCLSGVAVVIWWLSRAIRPDLCTPSYIQKTAFFCVVFFFCAHFVVRNLVGIKKEHRFEARCVYAICMRGHGKKTYTY